MNRNITSILEHTVQKLSVTFNNHEQAQQEAWWLIEHVTLQKKHHLMISEYQLTDGELKQLKTALSERIEKHKPLQYIIGSVPFLESTIKVKPPILIPRAETEEWTYWLIDTIQKEKMHNESLTMLDLCTGSGCIAIGLAQGLPQSYIIASDSNNDAVMLAKENSTLNGCSNITCIESNLFESLTNFTHRFDIIVSNPPYISYTDWQNLDCSVKDWEDQAALWAEDEGLFLYKKIIAQAPSYLNPNSQIKSTNIPRLILEIGHTQAQDITVLLEEAGYTNIQTHQDLEGKDRWISTSGLSV